MRMISTAIFVAKVAMASASVLCAEVRGGATLGFRANQL